MLPSVDYSVGVNNYAVFCDSVRDGQRCVLPVPNGTGTVIGNTILISFF